MRKAMSFGARLAEERKRLGHKQAHFAALVGSDAPKQSLYENGHRQLRAAYLERAAAVGVDVLYVLTGKRREGDWLGEQGSAMLSLFVVLPEELQQAVVKLVQDLDRHCSEEP
jgi:transcriptional regulator with XRE-family HTH domain